VSKSGNSRSQDGSSVESREPRAPGPRRVTGTLLAGSAIALAPPVAALWHGQAPPGGVAAVLWTTSAALAATSVLTFAWDAAFVAVRAAAVFIGLPLVIAELVLRVADPIGIRYLFEAREYFTHMVPDPDCAYVHQPGLHRRLQGVDVRINSLGLRGAEIPAAKPGAARRLLVLGDSIVFGWGVEEEDTFPSRMRETLRRDQPEWEVAAAGVGSWNVRTEREFLRSRWDRLQPDALVLVLGENDAEPKSSGRLDVPEARFRPGPEPRTAERLARFAATRSYLAAAVRWLVVAPRAGAAHLAYFAPESAAWRDARLAFAEIVGMCRERGVPLIVFVHGDGRSESSRAGLASWSAAARDEGLEPEVFPDALWGRSYRNSHVDSHPNPAGHALMASAILQAVRPALERATSAARAPLPQGRPSVPSAP
jgi:lysophospholipase L1-like esterase